MGPMIEQFLEEHVEKAVLEEDEVHLDRCAAAMPSLSKESFCKGNSAKAFSEIVWIKKLQARSYSQC